jgi:hypothetical protein
VVVVVVHQQQEVGVEPEEQGLHFAE